MNEINDLLLIVHFDIGFEDIFLFFELFFDELNSFGEIFDSFLENMRVLRISDRFRYYFGLIHDLMLGWDENGRILVIIWGTVGSFDSRQKFRRMKGGVG